MHKALKLWLWFVLIAYAVQAVMNLVSGSVFYFIYSAAHLAAVYLLLFRGRKLGFYLLMEISIFGMVLNYRAGVGLPLTILAAVAVPAITLLLMQRDWGRLA